MWQVDFTPAARREFDRLDGSIQKRISTKIDELEQHGPSILGVKKLQLTDRLYRVRVGDWRIVYQVDFGRATITIAHIAHRSQAYR